MLEIEEAHPDFHRSCSGCPPWVDISAWSHSNLLVSILLAIHLQAQSPHVSGNIECYNIYPCHWTPGRCIQLHAVFCGHQQSTLWSHIGWDSTTAHLGWAIFLLLQADVIPRNSTPCTPTATSILLGFPWSSIPLSLPSSIVEVRTATPLQLSKSVDQSDDTLLCWSDGEDVEHFLD